MSTVAISWLRVNEASIFIPWFACLGHSPHFVEFCRWFTVLLVLVHPRPVKYPHIVYQSPRENALCNACKYLVNVTTRGWTWGAVKEWLPYDVYSVDTYTWTRRTPHPDMTSTLLEHGDNQRRLWNSIIYTVRGVLRPLRYRAHEFEQHPFNSSKLFFRNNYFLSISYIDMNHSGET